VASGTPRASGEVIQSDEVARGPVGFGSSPLPLIMLRPTPPLPLQVGTPASRGTVGLFRNPGHRLLGLLAILVLASCGGDSSTSAGAVSPRGGAILGTVSVDGSGAPGLDLVLGTTPPRSATTDAQGGYRFDGVAPGTLPLTLQGEEDGVFPQATRVVEVTLGSQVRVDFSGALPRTGAIRGQVTASGTALEGIPVALQGPEARSAVTDSLGGFGFEALARGHWELRLQGVDRTRYAFPDTLQTLTLATGQELAVGFQGVRIPRPPATPLPPLAEAVAPVLVRVAWSPVPEADQHIVERRILDGPWGQLATLPGEVDEMEDPSVAQGGTYGYRLRACNADGCSPNSPEVRVTTPLTPPSAPGALTATTLGAHRIRLEWTDQSADETGFRIRRATEGAWAQRAELQAGATSWEDEGLEAGTVYRYQVQACGEGGCSLFSAEASTRTDDLPPGTPTALAAEALTPTRVRLTWEDGSGVVEDVRIQRRTGGSWTEVGTTEGRVEAFEDSNALPATGHEYRLRACNGGGCSPLTGIIGVTTPDAPPAAPGGLSASASGADRIQLAWQDLSSNETHFEIERREGSGAWTAATTVGPGSTTFQDTGLATATLFSYRIRACGDAGCSPWQGPASATTGLPAPIAPGSLTATPSGATSITLAWQDLSSDETGFEIQRRVDGGAWAPIHTTPASATSWQDNGVTTGQPHGYRVRSCNAGGCSAYTPEASATTSAVSLNLDIEAVHLNQVVQSFGGGVPAVAGRGGVLRVFVRANQGNSAQPSVRVRLYHGLAEVASWVIPAPVAAVPQDPDLSAFGSSWNVDVPAGMVVPGLRVLAEVDPDGLIPEADAVDNSFPPNGTPLALDVRTVPTFRIRFVPVHQSATGLTGSVDPGSLLSDALRLFPLQSTDADVRSPYTTMVDTLQSNDGNNAWTQLLSELNTLRVAEGTGKHYYGVVRTNYSSGVAGYGYVGGRTGVGWDRASSAAWVAAHEWGHNFGRSHAPCGVSNPDPGYPYAGGNIGQPGYNGTGLVSTSAKDLMGYCSPRWISDYTFSAVMAHRQAQGAQAMAAASGPVPVTIIWGRISADGTTGVLEPAFQVTAPPVLPEGNGPFAVDALDGNGTPLATWAFQGTLTGEEDQRHFAFAVPTSSLPATTVAIRLRAGGLVLAVREGAGGNGAGSVPQEAALVQDPDLRVSRSQGRAELLWDTGSAPLVVVRDAVTGEILSLARGGRASLAVPAGALDLIVSDGLRSTNRRINP